MKGRVRDDQDRDKNRLEESRRAEARAAELRPSLNMLATDPRHVPEEVIPHGWHYYWVRIGFRDEPDYQNEARSLNMGYTPVPAERHPELAMRYNNKAPGFVEGCIVKDGLMLCEIPKCIHDERQSVLAKEEYERVHSLNALKTGMGGDALMPGQVFSAQTSPNFQFGA